MGKAGGIIHKLVAQKIPEKIYADPDGSRAERRAAAKLKKKKGKK